MTDPTRAPQRNDIFLILLARGIRGFGDGFAIIILPVYLSTIGFTTAQIGIVATASLLGTAVLTLAVGIIAPRFELRNVLLAGAGMIVFSGLAFPNVEHIALVLTVAFVGTLNFSAGDLGALVPLEHAALTHEAAAEERTQVFARYSLVGSFATAVGSLVAAAPDFLVSSGLTEIVALKAMFYIYVVLGLVAATLYQRLPRDHAHVTAPVKSTLGESRSVVYKLAALFSLDAFAKV